MLGSTPHPCPPEGHGHLHDSVLGPQSHCHRCGNIRARFYRCPCWRRGSPTGSAETLSCSRACQSQSEKRQPALQAGRDGGGSLGSAFLSRGWKFPAHPGMGSSTFNVSGKTVGGGSSPARSELLGARLSVPGGSPFPQGERGGPQGLASIIPTFLTSSVLSQHPLCTFPAASAHP